MIKVVQCPACGWVQASIALKSFKCHRCDRTSIIHRVKVIKVVNNIDEARVIIELFNKRLL